MNLTLTSSCSGVEVISSTFSTVSSTLTLTSSTLTPSSSTLTPSSSTCTPGSSSNTTPRPSIHNTPRPSSSLLSTPGLDIPLNNTVSTPHSQISLSYRWADIFWLILNFLSNQQYFAPFELLFCWAFKKILKPNYY